MQSIVDVVIVGGGVIGCSIAYHLSKRGVMVAVFDRGEIGAESSSAATGLLAPLGPLSGPGPFAELLLTSFALFPTLVPEIEEASGIKLKYEQTGALRVVRDSKRIPNQRKRMQAWQSLGLHMHWLTGDEARQKEPLLAPDVCAAIYVPKESQINASRLVKAFAQAAVNQGAILYCDREIVGVQRQDTKIIGVNTSQGESFACGFSNSITAGGIAWLLNTAIRLAPALEYRLLEQMWAGLRPKTPDNQPILGPAPGWDNVTLAIGHGSVGIMLSAITGQTIAELILKGTVPKIVQSFSLARFKNNTFR